MGLFTTAHPEVSSGPLSRFGFYKAQQQTKTVIISMLERFFSAQSKSFSIPAPEIVEVQSNEAGSKLNIRRDFSSVERKFPMIIVAIRNARERKSFVGADNYLYTDIQTTPDGEKIGWDVFAGMCDIELSLIVVTTSSEERMRYADLLHLCFTHYFRQQFIYYGEDGSLFSITPATKQVEFGAENEITDESKTTLVYVTEVVLSNFIEYHFKDYASDGKGYELKNLIYEIDNELGVIER